MVYVILAEGFEEIEALTVVDVVRRAGVEVYMVSITSEKEVKRRTRNCCCRRRSFTKH